MNKRFSLVGLAAAALSVSLFAGPLFGEGITAEVSTSSTSESGKAWTQWRGPTRDGQFHGQPWPDAIKGQIQQLWRVEMGPGYSGPIVTKDRVFTCETADKAKEIVRALDIYTGEELWRHEWDGAMNVPFFAARNGSWIRSTPAWDGEHLFVAGMRDVLVCINGQSGEEVWRVDLARRFKTPLPDFGFVCSPLVDEQAVYVQAGASFVKLDKKTGETIWRTLDDGGGMNGSAFSSPTFATINEQPQVLVQTRTTLAGVNREDGSVIWKRDIPAFRGMNILTPLPFGDSVFTAAYGGKSHRFDIIKKENAVEAEQMWDNRIQGNMCSPVLIDGHIYFLGKNKRFCCVEAETGEIKYMTTVSFGDYMSLVANGDKILALGHNGTLYLFKANPQEFEMLDAFEVAEANTWAHLAVVDGHLYVRELKAMTAFAWPVEAKN